MQVPDESIVDYTAALALEDFSHEVREAPEDDLANGLSLEASFVPFDAFDPNTHPSGEPLPALQAEGGVLIVPAEQTGAFEPEGAPTEIGVLFDQTFFEPGLREHPEQYAVRHAEFEDVFSGILAAQKEGFKFNPAQARVSNRGKCQRQVVMKYLEPDKFDAFDETYTEKGFVLQGTLLERLQVRWPDAVQEVSVPTDLPGHFTHPDIVIPSLGAHMQVKVTKRWAMENNKLPKAGDVLQTICEADYLRRERGYWVSEQYVEVNWEARTYEVKARRVRCDFEAQRHFLVYLAQEGWGVKPEDVRFFEVNFEQAEANRQRTEYHEEYDYKAMGVLPKKKKAEADWECGWDKRDGFKIIGSVVCPGYETCWLRKYISKAEQKAEESAAKAIEKEAERARKAAEKEAEKALKAAGKAVKGAGHGRKEAETSGRGDVGDKSHG